MLSFDELEKGFTEEEALAEARRCLKCKNPLCVKGCPIENRIPEIIGAIEAKDYRAAIDIINENSNLAVICARVCPHNDQCEGACVLTRKGAGIRISKLERFLAEKEMELALNRLRGKVAVIGSGPAGLSVAATLAKQNYRVTIFEAQQKAGGVLRYGIPEYRLPNEVVDKQIEIVRNLGVRLETGVVIGEDLTLDQLFAMGYQAVFIGTGTGLSRKLGAEGENLRGAMQAIYFLETVSLIRDGSLSERPYPVRPGDRVLVVGAGNVAVDSARTALRLGAASVETVDIVPEKERRASDKEFAEAHCNLGSVLFVQDKLAEAVTCFRTATRLKKDFAGAYLNLGNALNEKGLLDAALAEYKEAVRHKPDSLEARHNVGCALHDQGRLDEAVLLCEDVREVCGDHGERWALAYALYVLGYADAGGTCTRWGASTATRRACGC